MHWDNPNQHRPVWMSIGDRGGELDVSIHRAAARGDVAELSRLLDAGHDINARCGSQDSALNYAIKANQAGAVQLLLLRGADPSLRGLPGSDGRQGDNAVLCAVWFNRVGIMEVLIANTVKIHSEALVSAAMNEDFDMVQLLVGTMSTDFADMPRLQAIGNTLPTAVHAWSLEMVQYLMQELNTTQPRLLLMSKMF
jgi:hypothetical protein